MPMTQQSIYPRDAYDASTYAKWFYLCAQNSGDIQNLIPGKAAAAKHASFSDATCWAAAGYATVGGSATNRAEIPSSTADLDSLATHTLVVTCRVKKTAAAYPGAEQQLYASYQPGSLHGGIILASLATGAARLYVSASDGTLASLTSGTNVITNGSSAPEVTLTFIVPREGGNGSIAVNGLETVTSSMATLAGKALAGGRTARMGVSLAGTAADQHGLASFAAYGVPVDGASLAKPQIYDWVHRNPHLPIPNWMFGL